MKPTKLKELEKRIEYLESRLTELDQRTVPMINVGGTTHIYPNNPLIANL